MTSADAPARMRADVHTDGGLVNQVSVQSERRLVRDGVARTRRCAAGRHLAVGGGYRVDQRAGVTE